MKPVLAPSYQQVDYHPLRTYQFPILAGTVHAVFTRLGGRSPAPWHGLNLSEAVGDSAENVALNLDLACRALHVDAQATVASHLVHENQVLAVDARHKGQIMGKFDCLITQSPDVILSMRFADCTPLLFYDRTTQSIGLAHAGWRGTVKNVMGATIRAMGHHFKSDPSNLRVVIGPSIGPCCYQVREDVFAAAAESFASPGQFFQQNGQGMTFDMWQANEHQAQELGVRDVVVSGLCTACRTEEFFSHRAEQGQTGRFGVLLGLSATQTAR